ncbi:hypothetical protein BVX98_02625 [bacterium F11]|nr:hypothetical protein BVX98_02625 [bacterium F11]
MLLFAHMTSPNEPQAISLRHHIVYTCSRLLAYGLPFLYFVVTTSFYLKTYDSAQVKITFTQIGTSILLFIWLVKILVEGRFPFRKTDMVFVAPFLAFLCSGLVSFIHGPFKAWPLEEALRRFFYIILALITIAEFRSEERMTRLWRWLLAAAAVSTIYGLIQFIDTRYFKGVAGIDPFIWRQAFGVRVFSTFGNPNFYGNFLVIVTPLIISLILKDKGSMMRPFIVATVTLGLIFCVDTMKLNLFVGFDPSFKIVMNAAILFLLFAFVWACFGKATKGGNLAMHLILFALLFLNLYATETKGAWLGFVAAVSITMWLIFEFFLHTEDRLLEGKKYTVFIGILVGAFTLLFGFMMNAFVLPLFRGEVKQVGFSILTIPVVGAMIVAVILMMWIVRKPWNMKKIIYGFLVIFIIGVGSQVLQFAKTRLQSVSFRIFTWIATWEMVQTAPLLGNGVGSFKVIYPAFRRPQIIVLERKSNTETDHAEDEYVEVWQDEGIIGFGIFLWLVFTALYCGIKQLRWYSRIRPPPEARTKKKWSEIEADPRSYEVLGILGAYGGALIHWTVDVSIRFVSSGIFSGLLPGLLVAYARNHQNPIRIEARLSYDRWIRAGLAAIWTLIIILLRMELVPQSLIRGGDTTDGQIKFFALLAGIGIFILIEFLEWGLHPEKEVSLVEQYPLGSPRFIYLRFAGILLLCVPFVKGLHAFGNFFQGDVHHNLAIFFSKQSIWRKELVFQSKLQKLPPDIREKYQAYGGALEHYREVIKKNPGFPMARYFTGNVYNDWGSQVFSRAVAQRKKDPNEAERLRQKALEKWNMAEEAYNGTKSLGPNYVQVHHQMGLLNTKRMQQAQQWGDQEGVVKYREAALKNFYLYRMLDPVFPPNYHRIMELLVAKKEFEEAEKLYKEAIYYNDVVARQIYKVGYPYRISELAVSLGRILFTHATHIKSNPFNPPLPQIEEALTYFQLAIDQNPKNVDAFKGKARLLLSMGRESEAQYYLNEAHKLAPNDPELRVKRPATQ